LWGFYEEREHVKKKTNMTHIFTYAHTRTHIYIHITTTTWCEYEISIFYALPPAIPTNAAVMTGVAAKTELTMPLNA